MINNLPAPTHTEAVEAVTVYVPRKIVLQWRATLNTEQALLRSAARPPMSPIDEQRALNRYLGSALIVATELAAQTVAALTPAAGAAEVAA